jgi:hypothetical protein
MGFDVYARWVAMTHDECAAQYTEGHGASGHLAEAYSGSPHALPYLCAEAFAAETGTAPIPATRLRARLPHALTLVRARLATGEQDHDPGAVAAVCTEYEAFVALCEEKEQATGQPVVILAQ